MSKKQCFGKYTCDAELRDRCFACVECRKIALLRGEGEGMIYCDWCGKMHRVGSDNARAHARALKIHFMRETKPFVQKKEVA